MTHLADLSLELHYGEDLVEGDALLVLQEGLVSLAPKVASTLVAHGFERHPDKIWEGLSGGPGRAVPAGVTARQQR